MSDNLSIAREYLMQRRHALIIELDALEDALGIQPRNSDLRREAKEEEQEKGKHELRKEFEQYHSR